MSISISSDKEQQNESAEKSAGEFLSTADDYFRSELKLMSNDYDCLTEMNISSLDKYKQMYGTLQYVNNSIRTMNDTNCTEILSTHVELNEIEDAMSNLESTIMNLDAYSRSLEDQLKKVEKTFSIARMASHRKE